MPVVIYKSAFKKKTQKNQSLKRVIKFWNILNELLHPHLS